MCRPVTRRFAGRFPAHLEAGRGDEFPVQRGESMTRNPIAIRARERCNLSVTLRSVADAWRVASRAVRRVLRGPGVLGA